MLPSGLCGVILAAGESSRMGRDKALLPWPKTGDARSTLLSSSIQALSDFCELVLVVAGANADNLRPIVYGCGADLVANGKPERGQFSSLQTALQEVLNRGRDSAMITLVDRPPVKRQTLSTLVDAFRNRAHGIWSIVPEFEGQHGHPILIGREMIEVFLRSPVSSSANELQRSHLRRIAYVETLDSMVITNVDTPEAYASLQALP
jgi:molybdenum cofactor cytidylyltransferase